MGNSENDNSVFVVTAQSTHKSERKKLMEIFFIVLAVIVAAAIIVGVIVSKSKKNGENSLPEKISEQEETGNLLQSDENTDFTPVTMADDVAVSFDGISTTLADDLLEHVEVATTTVAIKQEVTNVTAAPAKPVKPQVSTTKYLEETTTVNENSTQGSAKVLNVIKSFFGGVYYIDGTMINGGEKTPMEMGMNGSDFHVFSEMDGKDLAIVQQDGKTYLMNPDSKKYTEINAAIKKMMGITDESFSFSFSSIKFDAENPSSVTQATHNGEAAVCYTYKDSKNHLDFIAVNDEIVQFIVYGSDGTPETVIELDEFEAELPDEMFNFKGYHKTNMLSFMTELM